jgi:hypothetical protein
MISGSGSLRGDEDQQRAARLLVDLTLGDPSVHRTFHRFGAPEIGLSQQKNTCCKARFNFSITHIFNPTSIRLLYSSV